MAKASNLTVRILTAVVGVPAILALLYKAPAWAFFLLVLPAVIVGAYELFTMTHPKDAASRVLGVILTAIVAVVVFFHGTDARAMLTLLVLVPLAGPLVTLVRLGDMPSAALRACAMGFGPLFVGGSLTLLALLQKTVGPGWVILAIGFAWLSDTGGYFAGRFLGKHKLYEAVSPKKTIEGSLGGLAAVVAWAVLGHFWFLRDELALVPGIVLAVVAGALGQAGDLGESLIKRSTGVKDSGGIVPGHGGILDRVDALMVTSAIVFLYVLWR